MVSCLISFLEFLASRELIDFQNPYRRSPPFTKERINDARNAAKNDNCDDSFLIETALALGKVYFEMHKLRKFIYGVNCNHSQAIQVMDLYDKCKKYLENKYL